MIRLDVAGQLDIKQRLQLLKLPPAKRKRLMGQMARKVRVASRQRLRSQQSINGTPWAPRKGSSKRKMLRGLSKHMGAKGTEQAGTVFFDNPIVGRIARAQQDGLAEIMTAEKMGRLHGQPDYDAPATRSQAKALKLEGYKMRKRSGKGLRNASQREIMDTLTQGQAGIILRMMRDSDSKKTWIIPLPARPFLGASNTEIKDMVQTVFNQTINAPRRA